MEFTHEDMLQLLAELQVRRIYGMSANDKVLIMNSDEQQLVVRSLYELRNTLLEIDGPVEDVEDVLMKVIDAPSKRERRRMDRDER